MKVTILKVGAFQTNCYLLKKEDGLIAIDPGDGFRRINEAIQASGKPLLAVLLTHGHFDHIGAVDKLVEKYRCPVYMNPDDEKMARNADYNSLGPYSATISCKVHPLYQQHLTIGSFTFEVIYSPGHTEGSVMFLIEDKLFSGDTLFRLSVGRTDLYSGSAGKLMQSLRLIETLDENTTVYPGHDELTTVGFELDQNPYLR